MTLLNSTVHPISPPLSGGSEKDFLLYIGDDLDSDSLQYARQGGCAKPTKRDPGEHLDGLPTGVRLRGGRGGAPAAASTVGLVGPGVARTGHGSVHRARGAARRARQGGRTDLCTAVGTLPRTAGRGRW